MPRFTEDGLVQQTAADYLRDALGWESVFAYNEETFGTEGTLGRASDRDVVLTRTLGEKLITFNPGLLRLPARRKSRRASTSARLISSGCAKSSSARRPRTRRCRA